MREGPQRIGAVVMAAGAGRRMGHVPKGLLRRDGEPLLLRQIRLLAEVGVDEAVVVLGHHADRLEPVLRQAGPAPRGMALRWVANPAPDEGPGASLRCGLAALPDVPTFVEQGYDGLLGSTWAAMIAPAGVPREIVQRMSAEVSRIIRSAEVSQRLEQVMGTFAEGSTPEECDRFIAAETEKWGRVIREAKVTVD